MKKNLKLLLAFLLLADTAYGKTALPSISLDHTEFSIAGGANSASADHTHLIVSPFETDGLGINSVSSSPIWKIGAGYHFFEDQIKDRHFFNDIFAELNLYYSSQTINGTVYQYQSPLFNNYTFSAPVSSTRLMLDVKPAIVSYSRVSLYPIVGLGMAWNDIAYHETAIPGSGVSASTANSLGRNTNTNFAYDLGAGVKVQFTQHLFGVVEYLYTRTSGMAPSTASPSAPALNQPPSFALYGHSVMFGLNWKI